MSRHLINLKNEVNKTKVELPALVFSLLIDGPGVKKVQCQIEIGTDEYL